MSTTPDQPPTASSTRSGTWISADVQDGHRTFTLLNLVSWLVWERGVVLFARTHAEFLPCVARRNRLTGRVDWAFRDGWVSLGRPDGMSVACAAIFVPSRGPRAWTFVPNAELSEPGGPARPNSPKDVARPDSLQ